MKNRIDDKNKQFVLKQNKWLILMWGRYYSQKTRREGKGYVELLNYENNVSECNKLQSLIQNMIVGNTNIISQK